MDGTTIFMVVVVAIMAPLVAMAVWRRIRRVTGRGDDEFVPDVDD